MYNAKNYTEHGGDVTHIGGKLIVEPGAEVTGLLTTPAENLEECTATTVAGVKDSLNALIGAMKEAGLMIAAMK
ncbi:MAG: Head fiber protein [Ruminiclostridium sp.]|nr:Head fiber protein [Ruminiclostridium sp.]